MAKKPFGGDIDARKVRHEAARKVDLGGGVNRSAYEKALRRVTKKGNDINRYKD